MEEEVMEICADMRTRDFELWSYLFFEIFFLFRIALSFQKRFTTLSNITNAFASPNIPSIYLLSVHLLTVLMYRCLLRNAPSGSIKPCYPLHYVFAPIYCRVQFLSTAPIVFMSFYEVNDFLQMFTQLSFQFSVTFRQFLSFAFVRKLTTSLTLLTS